MADIITFRKKKLGWVVTIEKDLPHKPRCRIIKDKSAFDDVTEYITVSISARTWEEAEGFRDMALLHMEEKRREKRKQCREKAAQQETPKNSI